MPCNQNEATPIFYGRNWLESGPVDLAATRIWLRGLSHQAVSSLRTLFFRAFITCQCPPNTHGSERELELAVIINRNLAENALVLFSFSTPADCNTFELLRSKLSYASSGITVDSSQEPVRRGDIDKIFKTLHDMGSRPHGSGK